MLIAVNLPSSLSVGCKRVRISCGNRKFTNKRELMSHYNSFHTSENRVCIFYQCNVKFNAWCPRSAFNHFRLKQKQPGLLVLKLKPQYRIESGTYSNAQSQTQTRPSLEMQVQCSSTEVQDVQDEMYDVDGIGVLENDSLECQSEGYSDYYLDFYADFLNRLVHVKFIPQSTVQEIAEKYDMNTRMPLIRQGSVLRSLLHAKGIDKSEIDEIIKQVIEGDPFL